MFGHTPISQIFWGWGVAQVRTFSGDVFVLRRFTLLLCFIFLN